VSTARLIAQVITCDCAGDSVCTDHDWLWWTLMTSCCLWWPLMSS